MVVRPVPAGDGARKRVPLSAIPRCLALLALAAAAGARSRATGYCPQQNHHTGLPGEIDGARLVQPVSPVSGLRRIRRVVGRDELSIGHYGEILFVCLTNGRAVNLTGRVRLKNKGGEGKRCGGDDEIVSTLRPNEDRWPISDRGDRGRKNATPLMFVLVPPAQ